MSTADLQTNWAVVFDTATEGVTPIYMDGVQSVELSSGLQSRLEGGDGAVYNSHGSLVSGAPMARWSATDIKTVLDAIAIGTGKAITADVDNDGLELYFQRLAQGGTRDAAASTTHTQVIIANGLAVLQSLELPHQGSAVISAEAYVIEGAVAPLVRDITAALPSGISATAGPIWTLGKVVFNSTVIDGLSSVSIDFGVSVIRDTKDSDIYPTFAAIAKIQPTISLRGIHPDQVATITENGAYYTASQIVFYARKRAEGGTFVADGTAEHVKFTLGKCRVDWVGISGDPKELTMRLSPWDTPGGVAPLAVNTASAIT